LHNLRQDILHTVLSIGRCVSTIQSWSAHGYWALRWQRHSETSAPSILCSKQAAILFLPMFKRSQKYSLFSFFCTPVYTS